MCRKHSGNTQRKNYHSEFASKLISIVSWNVNGLFRNVNGSRMCKLDDPEFQENLKADIILLNETHACGNDVIKLEDYFTISNCRSLERSRLRGGVAFLIKQSLRKGVKIIDRSHPDIIWIKLCKHFFGFEQDIFLNAVYISPFASTYNKRTDVDKDIFNKIESDVAHYSNLGRIMILGDLNAHISDREYDFIHEALDGVHDFVPNNYCIDDVHVKRNTQIPQITNEYGRMLLDICRGSQLRILNGRIVGDSLGKATFHGYNGSSIDDYCICSSSLLKDVLFFQVEDFDINFSDHCAIRFPNIVSGRVDLTL